jgi:hypothetical protein
VLVSEIEFLSYSIIVYCFPRFNKNSGADLRVWLSVYFLLLFSAVCVCRL